MRFKLDENLPVRAAEALRAAGHDVVALLDQLAAGAQDTTVAQLVRDERRALITQDLDFADIRAYPPSDYHGIVVLRPRSSSANETLRLVARLVLAVEQEPLERRLWIVDEHRIRIRGKAS